MPGRAPYVSRDGLVHADLRALPLLPDLYRSPKPRDLLTTNCAVPIDVRSFEFAVCSGVSAATRVSSAMTTLHGTQLYTGSNT